MDRLGWATTRFGIATLPFVLKHARVQTTARTLQMQARSRVLYTAVEVTIFVINVFIYRLWYCPEGGSSNPGLGSIMSISL